MSVDIVIINVPCTLTRMPLIAPALLKGSLVSAGFSVRTMDFNIKFFNELENHINFQEFQTYFLEGSIDERIKPQIDEFIGQWVESIISLKPTCIMISVFTYQSRIATKHFCELIKRKNPNIKIMLGGQGLSQSGVNGLNNFPRQLKSENLIDHWIKSEGEISVVELIKGNISYPGIDSDNFAQIKDIDHRLPYPDYSDYIFDEYEEKILSIAGSRGCVRRCEFCDIHQHWEYTYRKGQEIVNEMVVTSDKYKIYDFAFTDSLVNGNNSEFRKFLQELNDYNVQNTQKITWSGQYIVRSKKVDNSEHWKLMKGSGCKEIWLGVESGSEKVRREMNKSFTDSDLDNTIEMASSHGIRMTLMLLVGYPTETIEDFEQTLNLLRKYKHLSDTSIEEISISNTVGILPGSPLYDKADQNKIILDPKHENNWINLNYPELDLRERIRRAEVAKQLASDLGYNMAKHQPHKLLEYLKNNIDTFEKRSEIAKKVWSMKQN